jgi:HSP90 family molecular chaperone
LIEDKDNTKILADLVRFHSSKSGDDKISFQKYVEGMKEGQKAIYFMAAENKAQAEAAPFVEDLVKRGYEVRRRHAVWNTCTPQRLLPTSFGVCGGVGRSCYLWRCVVAAGP